MLMAHKHTHTQQKVTHLHVHSWETHGDRSELKIYFIKNRSQLKFVKKKKWHRYVERNKSRETEIRTLPRWSSENREITIAFFSCCMTKASVTSLNWNLKMKYEHNGRYGESQWWLNMWRLDQTDFSSVVAAFTLLLLHAEYAEHINHHN